jgi:adenylate kinase family enzyme
MGMVVPRPTLGAVGVALAGSQPSRAVSVSPASTTTRYTTVPKFLVGLGRPGAGKGTNLVLAAEMFDLQIMPCGDWLRDDPTTTELTRDCKLVPNELALPVLLRGLEPLLETGRPVVGDGFPRDLEQGELFLDRIAPTLGIQLAEIRVLHFVCDPGLAIERCRRRRRGPDDEGNKPYERQQVYELVTQPVLDLFDRRGVVIHSIDASKEPRDVFRDLKWMLHGGCRLRPVHS